MKKMSKNSSELVRYSRAGDQFHYRWAARQCLKMIDSRIGLLKVDIEGSRFHELRGEYLVDISEYYTDRSGSGTIVKYYQLKHSEVRASSPFTLSELSTTFRGFAERFSDHRKKKDGVDDRYLIVTNRKVSTELKNALEALRTDGTAGCRSLKGLLSYTKLSEKKLKEFSLRISIIDDEGDRVTQTVPMLSLVSWRILYVFCCRGSQCFGAARA